MDFYWQSQYDTPHHFEIGKTCEEKNEHTDILIWD